MKKILGLISVTLLANMSLYAQAPITLSEAIEIVKSQNLEIKAATLDVQSAHEDIIAVSGNNWGKLDFVQNVMRSDDAGNVFGFKLSSREASFGDFGFADFDFTLPQDQLLATQPTDLNYPEDRNYFQSKLTYQIPLYAGGKISGYTTILESMEAIKKLDREAMINAKVYETRKSFYDMALLYKTTTYLKTIFDNITTLEQTTQFMMDEGYAKEVDLLEVQSKKANVSRLLQQMQSNQTLLYHYLSFLLNQPVDNIIVPKEQVPMPKYSQELILTQNIDIQKATKGSIMRREMSDVSRSGYLPEIGAFGEIQTADDTFLGDANDHKSYTIGAQLKWNLFNGGIDNAKIEKARVEEVKMNTQLELAKKGITLQVAKISTEIKSLDFEINSLKKELKLSNRIYNSYEERYKEQLASMSDVIIKQSQQIEKVLALLTVENRRNERIFALEKILNGAQN